MIVRSAAGGPQKKLTCSFRSGSRSVSILGSGSTGLTSLRPPSIWPSGVCIVHRESRVLLFSTVVPTLNQLTRQERGCMPCVREIQILRQSCFVTPFRRNDATMGVRSPRSHRTSGGALCSHTPRLTFQPPEVPSTPRKSGRSFPNGTSP